MATHPAHRGTSLIELVVTILILAILVSAVPPSFANLTQKEHTRQALQTFRSIFQFARNHAIYSSQATTVCAINKDGKCIRQWQGSTSIVVFLDRTKNRKVDEGDEVLRSINWPSGEGTIRWRSALGRPYITFLQMGNTWQNGTLYYCPPDNNARYANALVVNQGGRAYTPGDRGNDGINENRMGQNIECPA